MKLYGYWRSSSSHRVRIALHLKAVPFEYVAVNLLEDQQYAAEHLARSPMNKVPVLELDDGRHIIESLAIIQHLDETYPSPPLLPAEPFQRARARMISEMVNSGIQPFQNRQVGKYVRKIGGDEKEWCRHWIGQGLRAVEAVAVGSAGRFCVGDAVSLADVYMVPQILAARRFDVDMEPLVTLRRVEAACLELPGFQLARPEAQPDAPRPS
jgi:maleylpyruvate isomerase